MTTDLYVAAILAAIDAYGDRGDGVFTTAQIQHAMQERGLPSGEHEVIGTLQENPRVVQLKGGSHWLLLPNNHERDVVCIRCRKNPRFKKPDGRYALLCATCSWQAIVNFCNDEEGDIPAEATTP